MITVTELERSPCQQCGKCCEIHPCALAPDDLSRIANFLGLTEEELFRNFLVLDYVEDSEHGSYYVAPARNGDRAGRIVDAKWTFAESPCIFLQDRRCSIEQVKPKGGREFYCSLITNSNRNLIGYSKKKAAQDWSKSDSLNQLLNLAAKIGELRETPITRIREGCVPVEHTAA